jgi:iron complex outermembrane recepter protein
VIAPFIQFDFNPAPPFDNPYRQDGTMKIDAIAVYLQGTYSITPELRITAAGRYSSEKRTSDGVFTGLFVPPKILDDARRWSSFTPKFGIEYDVAEGTMLYASFTKGFKSGTFNVGQDNPAVNPEQIQSYEAGIKSRIFDNKVDLTAAYFHYKYKDLQVNKIIGIATLTANAAAAKTDGFEIAVNARVTPQFTLSSNFTYLDSTFADFCSINPVAAGVPSAPLCTDPLTPGQDLSGNLLPGSPKYAFVAGAQYVLPVGGNGQEVTLNADASYQSRIYFSEFNDLQLSQKGVTKVNASIRYDSGASWSVSLWGKNVFNEQIANNKVLGIQLWGFPIYGAIDAPATFGGTFGFKF